MNNKTLKQQSKGLILQTVIALIGKGIKPTQKQVSIESELSIITVKRYWHSYNAKPQVKKVSSEIRVSPIKVSSVARVSSESNQSFERLKRRVHQ